MKLIIYIALTALATCVLSQTLKLLFNTMVNKTKFSLSKITSDGNYPSSHTGFVTSVTTISWIYTIREILNSENANISVWCSMAFTALAVVIIRDALGVRYTVQKLCETVTKLAENAQEMLKFIGTDVIKDYDGFVDIVNQYEADADIMSQILKEFSEQTSTINATMHQMNDSMDDVSSTVGESANAVTSVAEDVAHLVDVISSIQEETENTNKISEELQKEVKRFEKV